MPEFRPPIGNALLAAVLLSAAASAAQQSSNSSQIQVAETSQETTEEEVAAEQIGDSADGAPTASFAEEMQVTASLKEEPASEVAASVIVIDRSEIRARQATTVAEAISVVPGLELVQSGPPGQATSLFTRGTSSVHTLVLWNGIRLNDPYFGGFNWAFLPTVGVERIEVARGPFSALYGSAAVGGVVRIVSGITEGVTASIEGGEDDYGLARFQAGTTVGDGLQVMAAGHMRRGSYGFANSEFESDAGMTHITWEPREGMEIGFLGRVAAIQTGIPFVGGAPDLNREIATRRRQLAVPVRMELGIWTLRGSLSHTAYESQFSDPDSPFGFTSSRTDSASLRARSVVGRPLGSWGRLAVGAEWGRLEVDNRSVFGTTLEDASTRDSALFGELIYDVDALRLEAGLRFDRHSEFGSATSPRLGAAFDLGRWGRVHASWGESFRAPSVGELFFAGTGNPDLEPERARGAELGWSWSSAPWRFGVVGFHNQLEDLIQFDFVRFTNVNVGRAETQGLELIGAWQGKWIEVAANATLQEASDETTGLPLLRRAEERANLVLTARPGPWTGTLTARWVGERPDIDPVTFERRTNPGHLRLDLAIRYRFASGFAPYARVVNLADREYAEALGFPAPGRRVIVGLGWNP